MKKVTVLMLVITVIMSVFAVSASANASGGTSYGKVPKTSTPISVDGQKDAMYDYGLSLPLTQGWRDVPAPSDLSGQMWMVYDSDNLYVFLQVNDPSVFDSNAHFHMCPDCGKQLILGSGCTHVSENNSDVKNLWNDDCIELFVDWTNNGGTPSQFRVNRYGMATRDWDTRGIGFNAAASGSNSSTWYAEFAIPLDNSKAGTQLGLTCMLHNETIEGDSWSESITMLNNSLGYVECGTPGSQYFDFIELGEEIDTSVPAPTQTDKDGNTITVPTDPSSGKPIDPSNPGAGNQSGKNPGTADPIVMIVIAAFAALGAAVVIKKTCFNK